VYVSFRVCTTVLLSSYMNVNMTRLMTIYGGDCGGCQMKSYSCIFL